MSSFQNNANLLTGNQNSGSTTKINPLSGEILFTHLWSVIGSSLVVMSLAGLCLAGNTTITTKVGLYLGTPPTVIFYFTGLFIATYKLY